MFTKEMEIDRTLTCMMSRRRCLHLQFYYIGILFAGSAENGLPSATDPNCWNVQDEVDPHWHQSRWNNGTRRDSSAAGQHWALLPELEPMRMEAHALRSSSLLASSGSSNALNYPLSRAIKINVPFSSTARLPCPVRQLGNRTVSWLRHTDDSVELLTVGSVTYSGDNRLVVEHRYPGNWTLKISPVALHDAGCYQCQVNTHPPISIFVRLQVQGPAVTIVDDRNVTSTEAVFKSGAQIRLICLVRQADKENFVLNWTRGKFTLNHDTERGGVSVRTERRGLDAVSWLLMARATARDAGIYTCSINNNQSEASVFVHVIQGEHQAAVQEFPQTNGVPKVANGCVSPESFILCWSFISLMSRGSLHLSI